MTRKEITGIRSLDFSKWVRLNLPDSSTGFSASDIDFIFWNWRQKKVMLLEIKTRMRAPREGQKIMWKLLDKWIATGIDNGWQYYGFHLIQFENTDFSDGKCFFDYEEISEEELIVKLSMIH